MLIFVKVPNGPATSLDVALSDNVATVKALVADRLGYTVSAFDLAFAGKKLTASSTLEEIGIKKEATLHLIVIPPIKLLVDYPKLSGGSAEIEVPHTGTVTDVKRRIAALTGFHPNLHWGSTVLQDGRTLASYELGTGEKLVGVDDPAKEIYTESPVTNNNVAENINLQNDKIKEDLIASFARGATSSKVEIVFSFDTTGSMSSCIQEVRRKVKETTTRLMKDIPDIRIGIIAHGDYCDAFNYVVKTLDLTKDVDKICSFVDSVKSTGGGDSPEAYELALREARFMSWRKDTSKALVVIGDEVPHCPSYTTSWINWWDELNCLVKLGVKVYGVQAFDNHQSRAFYDELSERSGAISIKFNSFHLMVDMFLAICYREASHAKLAEFQEEVQKDGKMTAEMGTIFETLSKPNNIIPSAATTTRVLKSHQPWYNVEADKGSPKYYFNPFFRLWSTIWIPRPWGTPNFKIPPPAVYDDPTESKSKDKRKSKRSETVTDKGKGKEKVVDGASA